jgi:pimeloyl-ACP methyl ester carboxylesterase
MVAPCLHVGRGEPLLLLHPFATSWHAWRGVAERLQEHHEIIAPTLPGHWGGPRLRLEGDGLGYVARVLGDAAERVLDDAGWATAHVAGNSLGGMLALELARRGRARTVTAIAPAGGWQPGSAAERSVALWFASRLPLVRIAPRARRALRVRRVRDAFLRDVCHHPERVADDDAEAFFSAVSACELYRASVLLKLRAGALPPLDGITCPVRFVYCEHDRLVPHPVFAKRFLCALPDARHEVLRDVGHVPMLEAPDRIAAIIQEHAGVTAAPSVSRTAEQACA